ncbi:ribonuclease P protein component [candidate division KSB1 bacterium]|nr:ribonuclease P protein component [candidate division KSB1 bacterium]
MIIAVQDKPVSGEQSDTQPHLQKRIFSNSHHLPKREIIKKPDDFRMIIQTGQKWTGRCVMVFYLPSTERRIGFAVSKKLGNAVFRNKIKRWMREAYRVRKHEIGSLQMILMAKNRAVENGLADIENDMEIFIRDAGGTCPC